MKPFDSQYYRFALYFTLFIGVCLRIVVYLQNRSLFLDEANVSLDIVDKNYTELFRPFESGQLMPPLFSSCVKLCTQFLGNNEFALRLFPLFIGILSIGLFYQLSRKIISDYISLVFVNWLFATSNLAIKYATEAKQYGFDVFMTLVLLLAVLDITQKPFTKKESIFWILLGMIMIWFSMPTVFILLGIGFYMILKKQSLIQSSPKHIIPILLIGSSWLLSFGLYYFFILSKGLSTDSLLSYHQEYFIPFIPLSVEGLKQWLFIQHEILRTTIGSTGLALGAGILFLSWGIIVRFRSDWKKGLLFTLPILVTWLVSSFGKYSMLPRLALFYLPITLLIIGIGVNSLLTKIKGYYKFPVIILLIIVASHQWSYRFFWQAYQVEEIKPVIEYLKSVASPEDIIYVHWEGAPAYEFYTRRHDDKNIRFNIGSSPVILTKWNSIHPQLEVPFPNSIWLVFSHSTEKTKADVLQHFTPIYQETKSMQSFRASCIYLKKRE